MPNLYRNTCLTFPIVEFIPHGSEKNSTSILTCGFTVGDATRKKNVKHVNTEVFGNNGKKRCETSRFLVSKKDLSKKSVRT